MGNKQLRPQQIGAIAYKLKLPDSAALAAVLLWCIPKVSQWKKQIGKRSSIFSQFPLFRLEDKSVLEEGDNVRTPVMDTRPIARPTIWRVYSRRKGAKSKC